MTVKSEEEATRIGAELIEQRLAACANIIGTSKSFYWWNGAVQSGSETVVILKTSDNKIDLLISTAQELHSYDCPAIVAIEIKKGNPDFLEWISKEIS
ncbi:MAG: divalent-cation tolerance protein CutA [Rhodospirillaceae bacterium]|nr:divalent-cation tolerance protein CutA [Rhodospirillaceae bacterium]|tara:strand:- start:255 stop:548 length:294 start_codon:yes stop_codon:yes gene_type:complete